MFCETCKGNQRVPDKGIWTKICPDCKGSGMGPESPAMKEMRQSSAFQVGYLRSAMKTIVTMLEHGNVEQAKLHAEDTLRTIVDND